MTKSKKQKKKKTIALLVIWSIENWPVTTEARKYNLKKIFVRFMNYLHP